MVRAGVEQPRLRELSNGGGLRIGEFVFQNEKLVPGEGLLPKAVDSRWPRQANSSILSVSPD